MPKQLFLEPNWNPNVVIPADGDLADGASLETPIQHIGNNTKFLFDTIQYNGVSSLRRFDSFDAMRATAAANGQIGLVAGYGLYMFVSTNTTAEALPWIVAPPSQSGRWIHELAFLRDVALPVLNAKNKIVADFVPNRIVNIYAKTIPEFVASSGGFREATALTTPILDVRAGDTLIADWSGTIRTSAAAGTTGDLVSEFGGMLAVDGFSGDNLYFSCLIIDRPLGANGSFQRGVTWTAGFTPTSVSAKCGITIRNGDSATLDFASLRVLHIRA